MHNSIAPEPRRLWPIIVQSYDNPNEDCTGCSWYPLPVLERFRNHLASSNLIPAGSRVLVGYSGGADSTCLLHLLHESGVDVVAAHLHHGQRDEAEKELALCEAFCKELGVPFASGRADVPRMTRDLKIGLEEAGRTARYGFFHQAALQTGCELIATAHTRNDQVETVLLNLARGCGLGGLAGIPERRDNIVRPLLPFSRAETKGYCNELGFWYHEDPANEDLSFSRARVRHRVLPELFAINSSADENIARLSGFAAEEDRFLNGMAAAALENAELRLNGALRFLTLDVEAAFSRERLEQLPPVLFKRSLRLACEALGGALTADQSQSLAKAGPKGSLTPEGGEIAIEWNEERFHVRDLRPTTPFRFGLTIPGETLSEEFGWQFTAHEAPPSANELQRSSLVVELDHEKMKGQLYFRTAQPGDQMQPLGFSGHRKLSDLLSEAKLTAAARARLPIICDMLGPIWAPGICLDERVRKTADTKSVILVSFGGVKDHGSHN